MSLKTHLQLRQACHAYRKEMGQLRPAEVVKQLSEGSGIPLVSVPAGRKEEPIISIDPNPAGSHLLIVTPHDGGWRDQLMVAIGLWPDAALVVDPDGRLYERTGHMRATQFGRVYRLPGYQLNMNTYYPFWHEPEARKLHGYLLPPYDLAERWLADRCLSLFTAVGHYGYAHKHNLISLLLDVATTDMLRALTGLETERQARLFVRKFTKGLSPSQAIREKAVATAFSFFQRQLQPYQPQYPIFQADKAINTIPTNWVKLRGSVYLTGDTIATEDGAGLLAAIVGGIIRHHMSHGSYFPLLVVLNEAVASRIQALLKLLQMVPEFGVTVILIVPSLGAVERLSGENDPVQLLGSFDHQLWYPPYDPATAEYMSRLYGTELIALPRETTPVYPPEAILNWPRDQVLVYARRERPYRFIGQRIDLKEQTPPQPPLSPIRAPAPRDYLGWLPALSGEIVQPAAQLPDGKGQSQPEASKPKPLPPSTKKPPQSRSTKRNSRSGKPNFK